jgi:hypothetical protein
MTKPMSKRRFAALIAFFSAACGADSSADVALHIELVSYSPDQLLISDDANDDLALVVRYEDDGADLGGGKGEVQDCRNGALLTILELPAIASEQASDADATITGELTLHVDDIGAASATTALPAMCSNAEKAGAAEAVFCLRLVDRAGHVSNVVCTGAIAVK